MKNLKNPIANFYPDKLMFSSLAKTHPSVPIVAELPLDKGKPPAGVFADLFYQYKFSFLLDSGKCKNQFSRYSFLGGNPFLWFKYQNQIVTIRNDKGSNISHIKNPLKSFSKILEDNKTSYFSYLPHFFGGGIGYFGYDLIHYLEPLPRIEKDDLAVPDIYFIFVDELIVIDHIEEKIKFICLPKTEKNRNDRIYDNSILRLIDRINQYHLLPCKEENVNLKQVKEGENNIKSNLSKKEFEDMVIKAKSYIKDGEIYQANLSRRFQAEFDGDPLILFQYLLKINPSPFSAFLRFDDFYIVSSSPERLLKVHKDRIETRPIAGTRPRGKTTSQDQTLSSELLLNEKENAEHLMLVDLERNDLGRLCQYGSVHVNEFMKLEKYSHVWHIVSNIIGNLRNNIKLEELLKACFPGGTITGCPKIRSMEIINKLENINRGPYTGSLGYIGFSGEIDLNIIIRTLLVKNNRAYFHVGAGIVADSNPEREFFETYNKAEAILIALQNLKCGVNDNV